MSKPHLKFSSIPEMPYSTGFGSHHVMVEMAKDAKDKVHNLQICGDKLCKGDCGYPRLIVEHQGRLLRARNSAVACGPVFNVVESSDSWEGEVVHLPDYYDVDSVVERLYWW